MKKLILVFIALSFYGEAFAANIPSPTFGVSETVVSVYGKSDYYTHWIDNTAGNCSDSGNGTPSAPRCTIPTVSGLAAGSVVQLRGGPYTGSILTVGGIGTSSKPIFFRGESSSNKVLFSRHLRIRNAAYLVVENINFTATSSNPIIDLRSGSDTESTTYISIRDNEATGTGLAASGSAMSGGGTSYALPGHDIVYLRNKVHGFGIYESATENDTHCLGVGTNHYNNWYLNNELYRCSGDGIGNGHDANHKTYNLFIDGNKIYNNRENAIDLKEVHDVIISNNIMYGYARVDSSSGEVIALHYGPTSGQGPYNVWVLNNIIHDGVSGYVGSDVEAGHYVIGNLFYDLETAVDLNNTGGGEYHIYHNTIINSGVGLHFGVNTDTLDFGGNLVANTKTGAHQRIDTTQMRTLATVNKELYWQGGSNVTIGWGSTYTSVAAWVSASGKGAGSVQADPLFVDAYGKNYRLRSGSPAIDAGVNMSNIEDTFQASFPTASILTDIAGVSRPDGVWDIGAYEYGSTTAPSPSPVIHNINTTSNL